MHPKTVSKIRELKIQKKRKQAPRDKNKNKWQRPKSINLNSLIHIDCHTNEKLKQHRTNLKLMLLNAQSIRNKDTMICDYIMDNKIDVTLITETWITDQDQIWLDCCDFKQHGLNIDTSIRLQRKGGGLALISRSNIRVKHLKKSSTRSFEYAIWKIMQGSYNITILLIYHPPYSEKCPITNNMFVDDFSDFLSEFLMTNENILVMGDFNIHHNDLNNPDTQMFSDTVFALGPLSTLRVNAITLGPYFSDHCAIKLRVSVPKPEIERKSVKFRKAAEIDSASFVSDLDITGLESEENLNILVVKYSRELRRVLNIHAPEIERKITIRHKNPWFKPELRHQKWKVQQRECVWRKYHQQHQWEALKRERKVYRSMFTSIRTEVLSNKVKECNNNPGKLYNLVKELTNTKAKNPLPEASSDEELANQFVDYFMNKIKNITEALDKYPEYLPSNTAKDQLNTFTEVTQDQVIYYIKKMPTKGCELDPISN